ncbi:MAG: hypothetical protein ISR55_08705 [Bacteroidetes bacterium]|nr:hypothetical protein [Bacteroidota bacterium]MBL6963890.1 hypothetical protein [Bacteroidota bacterium]
MFLKQLIFFILLVGISVFLLNIKALFRKNGKLEKSCTSKHRLMHEKGLDCEGCEKGPMECDLDKREHQIHHPLNS